MYIIITILSSNLASLTSHNVIELSHPDNMAMFAYYEIYCGQSKQKQSYIIITVSC